MGLKGKWQLKVLMTTLSLVVAAGCTSNGNNSNNGNNGNSSTASESPASSNQAKDSFSAIPENVGDSSDLSDWTGKQLKLNVWNAHGTDSGSIETRKSEGDVVTPEMKRVTGVTLDLNESFDNAGQTAAVKSGLLAAANNWPSLVNNPESQLKALVDAGVVYDLTDLLPKYAPNLMKKIPPSLKTVWNNPNVNAGYEGKIYTVPTSLNAYLPDLNPDIDRQKYSIMSPADDKGTYVWVRDDILKKLYPNAKTEKELEDLYVQKGTFDLNDILDVPINSKEDFIQMLYNIQKLGIKENNKEVAPFFTFAGQDNWALMSFLGGALDGYTSSNDYFTYWDKETQKVEYMFKQPFFKDSLKEWNQLLRDGVASKEALVDPYNTFAEKLNSGMYAVSYAWLTPDNGALKKAGKTYQYRKVYLNIPVNDKKFVLYKSSPTSYQNYAIFKSSVKEEDLPQVLRWFDYMVSDAGEKLRYWGPKSAGLFEEKDGNRQYTDKELEQHMVYKAPNDKGIYYNVSNGMPDSGGKNFPTYATSSVFNPIYTYDRKRDPADVNTFFNVAIARPFKTVAAASASITNYTSSIPEVDKAWKARQAFEDALTKVIAASSDEQFEQLYADFLKIADNSGYNDAMLQKVDEAFRQKNAADMDLLK